MQKLVKLAALLSIAAVVGCATFQPTTEGRSSKPATDPALATPLLAGIGKVPAGGFRVQSTDLIGQWTFQPGK